MEVLTADFIQQISNELPLYWFLLLILIAFVAGFIDAIAGGGGMLQLPALLLAGIPPAASLAINKLASISGTLLAVIKYASKRRINWKLVSLTILPCLIASYFGAQTALRLAEELLAWLILLCIPIALYFVLRHRQPANDNHPEIHPWRANLAVVPIGFYDGLLGPGTGSYMTISVNRIVGLRYLDAAASIKPLNMATNLGAAIAFILAGKLIWILAIPMMLANAAGGWIGSHTALHKGDGFVRNLLIAVLSIMLLVNAIKLLG